MSNQWQERLEKLLKEKNTIHNTTTLRARDMESLSVGPEGNEKSFEVCQDTAVKTAKTTHESFQVRQDMPAKTAKTPDGADELGLVAMWSGEFGYVSLHDPTTNEWHDLQVKDAPGWALGEARRRKELARAGDRTAYRLSSREMERLWRGAQPIEEEGITEDHPLEEENEQ
jgi:hypothetical protein